THDQEEALTMSDRIAVMNAGRIEQVDDAAALYQRPRTRFVAQFLGLCNLIPATVCQADAGFVDVTTPIGRLRVRAAGLGHAYRASDHLTLAIRPELIRLAGPVGRAMVGNFCGQVEALNCTGALTQYSLEVNGFSLKVVALSGSSQEDRFKVGD